MCGGGGFGGSSPRRLNSALTARAPEPQSACGAKACKDEKMLINDKASFEAPNLPFPLYNKVFIPIFVCVIALYSTLICILNSKFEFG